MRITITGTPGTGKTYLSKKLSKLTGIRYFDLNAYIKEEKLYDSYDKKDKTYDINPKTLEKLNKSFKETLVNEKSKALEKFVNKKVSLKDFLKAVQKDKFKGTGVIIDSHLSHYFDSNYCIIVTSDIKNINKRLKGRNYSKNKIKDNVEAEIFQVCLDEARKLKRKIIVIEN